MWSPSRPQRIVAVGISMLSLLFVPAYSSASQGAHPGLPFVPEAGPPFGANDPARDISAWLGAPINGLAGSVAAKQWAQIPLSMSATSSVFATCTPPEIEGPTCPFELDESVVQANLLSSEVFLVSPDGSDDPYGAGPLIPVRTVAFGSIPVEVEVQVQQVRDSDDLPVPLVADIRDTSNRRADGSQFTVLEKSTIKGDVIVRIAGLTVDGIDLRLGKGCKTTPTALEAESQRTQVESDRLYSYNPREAAYGLSGGGFSALLDIPAFAGCRTSSGDDVSPLITSALSGPDNPVSVQYGSLFCNRTNGPEGFPLPVQPGDDTPDEAGCFQFQYDPDNALLYAIPLPWDIPDYAPGDQPSE